ncbi:DNA-binding protein [Mesorhizobium sp. M2D.F.Ca.ET.171.01.1.1]|uniref:helix-turn-helix domain-containing protein n=1 Tax=unclassified Mesorhizobium TaxID=325217 RepID=UPI0010922052|nr:MULTISPECIES: helix-turn-helix domain-containing protein [unclassified Mesorhizobium]TGS95280.1 DNA-binding protein [Mesorhizobium sp. M2D.F.Ca.ET.178.01.1.1]TGT10819.1 DNA-binding protein [Mesorhizobium sp. M2D.F.Ca.ET.171.01.1.1]
MNSTNLPDSELDLIWGADAIARALNLNTKQTFYALESGKLPARKVGKRWVTSRQALRRYFGLLTGEAS